MFSVSPSVRTPRYTPAWLLLKDSCHLPHPTCSSCPGGGSSSMKGTAESWWSEVTNLGHDLNGSHKNRLHYNLLLVGRQEKEGLLCEHRHTSAHWGVFFSDLLCILITRSAKERPICRLALIKKSDETWKWYCVWEWPVNRFWPICRCLSIADGSVFSVSANGFQIDVGKQQAPLPAKALYESTPADGTPQ